MPRASYFGRYVQALNELRFKEPVRACSTAHVDIGTTGVGAVMDTVTLALNNRVLLKDQSPATQNGIFTVGATSLSRATDLSEDSEISAGMIVAVEEGSANIDKIFMLTTNNPIYIGITSLTFAVYGGGGGGGTASKLSKGDIWISTLNTSADGDLAMTPGLAATPVGGGNLIVFVDGIQYVVGDGVKTRDCYVSGDAGVSARLISSIIAGDTLHWVGSVAGFELSTLDKISVFYSI